MSHEITGTILEIQPEQQFASGFSKREFVVTTRDKYPQPIKLEFTKERCAQLDDYQPGDPVKVSFNLRGNEHQGRHYVNLQAWKIEPEGGAAATTPRGRSQYPPAASNAPRRAAFYDQEDDDGENLPF
jgi:single-strand DNA-binding protein